MAAAQPAAEFPVGQYDCSKTRHCACSQVPLEAASVHSQAPGELLFGLSVGERPIVERPQPFCELGSKLLILISSLHKVLD
jgi:hypothetical protein